MESLRDDLRERAREADELHARSRQILVGAVRDAATAGLTQREIAAAVGRSQPEVSRLLRFHGRTTLGRSLETNRRAILKALSAAGAKNARVFGSVSRGEDGAGSDVDLVVDFSTNPSLFSLASLEAEIANIVGAQVDITPSASLRPSIARRALRDAVPL